MALSQIAARSVAGAEDVSASAEQILSFLSGQLVDPRQASDIPFVALAVGLLGAAYPGDSATRPRLGAELLDLLRRHRNPDFQGALALALGLLRTDAAGPDLRNLFQQSNDAELRGHLAVALGLLRFMPARDDLREALEGNLDPALRIEIVNGLGLMGDTTAALKLVESLNEAGDGVTSTSLAWSLATLRDPAGLDAVLKMAAKDRNSLERRNACTALGVLAEGRWLPWHADLAMGSNYMLPLSIQIEILGLF
ncbi:MAG: HEAT repeat domain-containing protein [Planctomycetota bacterium]